MNHRAVYIASKTDQSTWHPIGRLSRIDNAYEFVYLQGAKQAGYFGYLPGMTDHNLVYRSEELFPFFKNRLLSEKRSEYKKFLDWADLSANDLTPEPLAILEITEGKKSTDNYEVFPCPVAQGKEKYYEFKFFLHGARYLTEHSRKVALDLTAGESLRAMHDWQNGYNDKACVLCTSELVILGYLPDYLVAEVDRLREKCAPDSIKFSVEKVNRNAPVGFSLLCALRACWDDELLPFSDAIFKPIPPEVPESCQTLELV